MNHTAAVGVAETDTRTQVTALMGEALLEHPLLNKGSAFTEEERRELGLLGLVPPHVADIDEQLVRTYENYARKDSDLERYIFLAALHDRNEILFYRLLLTHIAEMAPIVYTPTVGLACQEYSHIYRRPRGLYIDFPHRAEMDTMLAHAPAGANTRVIVVTDGERILGIGDQGVGGMGIPVGKLALYSVCAGIHPAATLPIVLDVGTDNEELLHDPLYLGWHHERIRGQEYDDFVDAFVQGVKRAFPHAVLQWEDFAKGNARRLLTRYQHDLCTFNDDIQGTGAVTLAGLLAAVEMTGTRLADQRVVILGAGSAATGIAEQVIAALVADGLSEQQARSAIWLLDRHGLVHTGRLGLEVDKRPYARPWIDAPAMAGPDLAEVVMDVHPTVLIGTAAEPGTFTEEIVRQMARHTERPVIFPISNPTDKCEAVPADLVAWTDGRAHVATGSPFPPVTHAGREVHIGQCNNMFIFPGVGLGVIASGARHVTQEMFVAAARALSDCSPARKGIGTSLYPEVADVREVSRRVAVAVAREAQRAGLADPTTAEETERRVAAAMWEPRYPRLVRAAEAK